LVLKGPDVDDETMCFEAWEFQALTHKDRTAKSAILPFRVRKVKKGHRSGADTSSKGPPLVEARPFRHDHTLFRLKKKCVREVLFKKLPCFLKQGDC
jgi:hypothetical protein